MSRYFKVILLQGSILSLIHSCKVDRGYSLYGRLAATRDSVSNLKVISRGSVIGKVVSTTPLLQMHISDKRLDKASVFFYRDNPLGMPYIDVLEPDVPNRTKLKPNDTVTINVSRMTISDSSKRREILDALIDFTQKMDTILAND